MAMARCRTRRESWAPGWSPSRARPRPRRRGPNRMHTRATSLGSGCSGRCVRCSPTRTCGTCWTPAREPSHRVILPDPCAPRSPRYKRWCTTPCAPWSRARPALPYRSPMMPSNSATSPPAPAPPASACPPCSSPKPALPPSPPVLAPRIDRRGVAVVNSVGAPFTDANADGLPDVDGLGRFVPGDSSPVPLPFFVPGVAECVTRDANGRALAAPGGPPLYAYVDARRTLLGQLVSEVPPMLVTEGTPPRSTVTELLDGLHVLWGPRDGSKSSTRAYPPVTVAYDAFHGDEAPLLDLLHVGAQWLGQPAGDDPLQVLRALVMDHPGDVARLVALLRTLSRTADAHPEARLKEGNTLRDDLVNVLVEI